MSPKRSSSHETGYKPAGIDLSTVPPQLDTTQGRETNTLPQVRQSLLGPTSKELARTERFWAKVHRTEKCWEWQGTRNTRGYGIFGNRGAHRVAYEFFYGLIPDGLVICHKCDNPPCVRPDHLFAGTRGDNFEDMIRKGRHPYIKSSSYEWLNEFYRWADINHKDTGILNLWRFRMQYDGTQPTVTWIRRALNLR